MWTGLRQSNIVIFECCQGCRIEELQLSNVDRSKAIRYCIFECCQGCRIEELQLSNVDQGQRQSVPLKLRCNVPNLKVIFDLENFKCRDYYFYLIKKKYEKPSKWRKLKEEFILEDKQVSEAFMMPLRVANEPYLRSFQYKVLNSILYTNELLCKIGYVSNPNCSFCEQTIETISHIFFYCSFAISFWKKVYEQILNKLKSCKSPTPEYRDIILGFSEEKMDLLNYILILGKSYLWTCRCKEIKPCLSHFERILINKNIKPKNISLLN